MLHIHMAQMGDLEHLSGQRIIVPGRPEPEWLHRKAEHARILREMRAEKSRAESAAGKGRPRRLARLIPGLGRD